MELVVVGLELGGGIWYSWVERAESGIQSCS